MHNFKKKNAIRCSLPPHQDQGFQHDRTTHPLPRTPSSRINESLNFSKILIRIVILKKAIFLSSHGFSLQTLENIVEHP
jgi:hypothetical protein